MTRGGDWIGWYLLVTGVLVAMPVHYAIRRTAFVALVGGFVVAVAVERVSPGAVTGNP